MEGHTRQEIAVGEECGKKKREKGYEGKEGGLKMVT